MGFHESELKSLKHFHAQCSVEYELRKMLKKIINVHRLTSQTIGAELTISALTFSRIPRYLVEDSACLRH